MASESSSPERLAAGRLEVEDVEPRYHQPLPLRRRRGRRHHRSHSSEPAMNRPIMSLAGSVSLFSKIDRAQPILQRQVQPERCAGEGVIATKSSGVLKLGRSVSCSYEMSPGSTPQIDPEVRLRTTASGLAPGETSNGDHQEAPGEAAVQPILSVDRDTGIIAVNKMWSCSRCSYAYNSVTAGSCDVCCRQRFVESRSNSKSTNGGQPQLVTTGKTTANSTAAHGGDPTGPGASSATTSKAFRKSRGERVRPVAAFPKSFLDGEIFFRRDFSKYVHYLI